MGNPRIHFLLVGGCLVGSAFLAAQATSRAAADSGAEPASWSPVFTAGFDTYVHSYPLAEMDTTETIAEYLFGAGLEGRSARKARHRWRLLTEASLGSELTRQRLEGEYSHRDGERRTRLRVDGSLRGRQYRGATEYSLSSDNLEGRLAGRVVPLLRTDFALEARSWARLLTYESPSVLEADTRTLGGGLFLRSRGLEGPQWRTGVRLARLAYPDSSVIDRTTATWEGDWEVRDLAGRSVRISHRMDRRRIRDETVRPSAWLHWTDLACAVPVGRNAVVLEAQNEVWRYGQRTEAYFDSWRLGGFAGVRWGDLWGPRWRLGIAAENLAAEDSGEAYTQAGLRCGVESYGLDLSGSLTLEAGRRIYADPAVDPEWPAAVSVADTETEWTFSYSDFTYWKIWLMANWRIDDHFSLDLLASYEPERHTEPTDDSALGFGSVRLVYRP